MASMNISVPDPMREWVQRRIESGEYASVSDYVRDLIRRDQNAQTRRLSVEDIGRTIEEGRAAAGGTSPAEGFILAQFLGALAAIFADPQAILGVHLGAARSRTVCRRRP